MWLDPIFDSHCEGKRKLVVWHKKEDRSEGRGVVSGHVHTVLDETRAHTKAFTHKTYVRAQAVRNNYIDLHYHLYTLMEKQDILVSPLVTRCTFHKSLTNTLQTPYKSLSTLSHASLICLPYFIDLLLHWMSHTFITNEFIIPYKAPQLTTTLHDCLVYHMHNSPNAVLTNYFGSMLAQHALHRHSKLCHSRSQLQESE